MFRYTTIALLAAVTLAACDTPPAPPASATTEVATTEVTPSKADLSTKAATIAKAIRVNPNGAEGILREHGLTEATFETMMYNIANDAAAAKKYAELIAN
ncbi:MAG: hypothetical protein ACI9MC_002245 [Kiritimatiellia bacterium]|jgi:hypothetical protein